MDRNWIFIKQSYNCRCWLKVTVWKTSYFLGMRKNSPDYVQAHTHTVIALVHMACGHFHHVTWPFLALLCFAEPLPSPNPRSRFFLMQINGMSFGWPECGQPAQPLIPAHNNGVKGSLPKLCLFAWHPTALLGSLHLEPKPHREASSLVTRVTPAPRPKCP